MSRLDSNKRAGAAAVRSVVAAGGDCPVRRARRQHQFVGETAQPGHASGGEQAASDVASSRCLPTSNPTVEMIKSERRLAGLSQPAAAQLVGLGHGSRWAEFESGTRPIDGARWELFLLKIGRHPYRVLTARRDDGAAN